MKSKINVKALLYTILFIIFVALVAGILILIIKTSFGIETFLSIVGLLFIYFIYEVMCEYTK